VLWQTPRKWTGFLIVREIKNEDAGKLAEFFERNDVEDVTRNFHPFRLDNESATRIAEYQGRDKYYIAIIDDSLAGFAMLRGWDEGYTVPSFGLLVDLEYQGRGIGRELSVMVLNHAATLSDSVRLSVNASNVAALQLYRSLGFRVIQRKKAAPGVVFIMKKEFEDD